MPVGSILGNMPRLRDCAPAVAPVLWSPVFRNLIGAGCSFPGYAIWRYEFRAALGRRRWRLPCNFWVPGYFEFCLHWGAVRSLMCH